MIYCYRYIEILFEFDKMRFLSSNVWQSKAKICLQDIEFPSAKFLSHLTCDLEILQFS